MNRFTKIFFLPFIVGFIVACQPLPSAILQNESCSPPCWEGIIPGHTTIQEVNTILGSTSIVDIKSIKMISTLTNNDTIDFNFFPNERESGGRIYSQDGVVQAISFWPQSNTLRLSETLQKWGSPDQYISIYYSKAEVPYLATNIIYTKQGIILNSGRDMRTEEVPRFDNNFSIQVIRYINPKLITTLLKNGSIDALSDQDIQEGLRSWTGLGEVEYLKRDLWGIR